MPHKSFGQRCAVLGSGMAGLFAARVVSDHFDEVILIDRDDVPNTPIVRGGIPQGRHFHALLPGGLAIGEELFPGLAQELEAAGAVRCGDSAIDNGKYMVIWRQQNDGSLLIVADIFNSNAPPQ